MDSLHPNAPGPGLAAETPASNKGRTALRFVSPHQLVGILFVVSQAIFVLQTHFLADNTRLLTPVEGLTRYELHATLAQRRFTAAEIQHRYGILFRADVPLTVGAVRAAIVHLESSAPEWNAPFVRLRTREPNGTEDYWLWPQE